MLLRVIVLALLVGCDPGFELRGFVIDARGMPVENVKVQLNCGGSVLTESVSGRDGSFRAHKIGAYADCMIEAIPPQGQYKVIKLPMMPYCTKPYRRGTCLEVTVDIQLP